MAREGCNPRYKFHRWYRLFLLTAKVARWYGRQDAGCRCVFHKTIKLGTLTKLLVGIVSTATGAAGTDAMLFCAWRLPWSK